MEDLESAEAATSSAADVTQASSTNESAAPQVPGEDASSSSALVEGQPPLAVFPNGLSAAWVQALGRPADAADDACLVCSPVVSSEIPADHDLTHFPIHPKCPTCVRCKCQRVSCPRAKNIDHDDIRLPKKYGDA